MSDQIILQEKHTARYRRHLWLKKYTYYMYYRYFEGSMVPVAKYLPETIKAIEKGK